MRTTVLSREREATGPASARARLRRTRARERSGRETQNSETEGGRKRRRENRATRRCDDSKRANLNTQGPEQNMTFLFKKKVSSPLNSAQNEACTAYSNNFFRSFSQQEYLQIYIQ